jgi:hypothetical protein
MTRLRVAIGTIWVVSFVAGRGWLVSPPASANAATSAEITAQPSVPVKEVGSEPQVEDGDPLEHRDPALDLFGNEIEEAIADYRVDLRGTIYERHSPETAVSKLGSPTT